MLLFNKCSYFVLDTANYCVHLLIPICSCHSFSVVYIYIIIYYNFFFVMYACMYIYMYVCMYVYIYIYIYIYIYLFLKCTLL